MTLNYLWYWCVTGQKLGFVCLFVLRKTQTPLKCLFLSCYAPSVQNVFLTRRQLCYKNYSFITKNLPRAKLHDWGSTSGLASSPPHLFCLLHSACVMPVSLMKIQLKIPKEVEKSRPESIVSLGTFERKWLLSPGQCFTEAVE